MDFAAAFQSLTGHAPMPWQRALYERFVSSAPDNIPASCNLPTGLGKTSVVAVWLIALANHPEKMPRRLVYVANRRTVVDQTTDEVEKYRKRLQDADLDELRKSLNGLSAIPLKDDEPPLALSTLRGQFADNREWSTDPARPAVICGTVDMIGSRLLFSGYGVGWKSRPLHAGFLGQDALLVHDEAHLEPAFQELLVAIEREQALERKQHSAPLSSPGLRVMELSATTRNATEPFGLSDADNKNPTVIERINAPKGLHLHALKDAKKPAEELAGKALEFVEQGRAILVFARTVDDVLKVEAKLPKVALRP